MQKLELGTGSEPILDQHNTVPGYPNMLDFTFSPRLFSSYYYFTNVKYIVGNFIFIFVTNLRLGEKGQPCLSTPMFSMKI